MIGPRFLFAVLVCIPCLFIDDVVRMDAFLGQFSPSGPIFSSELSDCQILEERKNLDFVFQFIDNIQQIAHWESLFRFDVIDHVSFVCPVVVDTYRPNFAEYAVSVQQFTSRCKSDTERPESSGTGGINFLFTVGIFAFPPNFFAAIPVLPFSYPDPTFSLCRRDFATSHRIHSIQIPLSTSSCYRARGKPMSVVDWAVNGPVMSSIQTVVDGVL